MDTARLVAPRPRSGRALGHLGQERLVPEEPREVRVDRVGRQSPRRGSGGKAEARRQERASGLQVGPRGPVAPGRVEQRAAPERERAERVGVGRRARRRRDRELLLARAGHRTEVGERGLRIRGEDVESILRPSPARGGEESVGGGPGEEENLPGGGLHRLARERLLGGGAAVDLAAGRRAQIVALCREVAAPLDGVGPRRDGLRLQGLELVVNARPHLERDDAEKVLLEADPVDDVKRPAGGRHEKYVAPIAGVVHGEERGVRRLELEGRRDFPHPVRPLDEEGADRRAGGGEADEERLGDGVTPHAREEGLELRPAARFCEPDTPSAPRLGHRGREGEEGPEAHGLGLGELPPGERAGLDLERGRRGAAGGPRRPKRERTEMAPGLAPGTEQPVTGRKRILRTVGRDADVRGRGSGPRGRRAPGRLDAASASAPGREFDGGRP